jgi:hypothetical protein
MGTGNYQHADGTTVIVDLYDGLHEQADGDEDLHRILAEEAFDDLKAELETALRGFGFEMDGETWRGRSELILAQSATHQVWSHEDSYGHVFLTIGLHEDIEEDVEDQARDDLVSYEVIFDRLQEVYDLRVATSSWTSGPRAVSVIEPTPLAA